MYGYFEMCVEEVKTTYLKKFSRLSCGMR